MDMFSDWYEMCRTGFSSHSLSLTNTHTHNTLQGPTDSDLSTRDFANTAAVCPNWAGYKESPIGEIFVDPPCGVGDAVMTGGGYAFTSPAVDWQGVCVGGVCAICHDGERRCFGPSSTGSRTSDAGIPQVRL